LLTKKVDPQGFKGFEQSYLRLGEEGEELTVEEKKM